jgi:hypothetical protein
VPAALPLGCETPPPWYPFRSLGEPHSRSGRLRKQNNLLFLQGIKQQFHQNTKICFNQNQRIDDKIYSIMRTVLFGVITQRVVVISYRCFGTTYRSYPQGSRIQNKDRQVVQKCLLEFTTTRCIITQKSAVLIYSGSLKTCILSHCVVKSAACKSTVFKLCAIIVYFNPC